MMKKVCVPVLAVLLFLFVSCAAGTNSADGSVGYITLGSSRAGLSDFSITSSSLTNLELAGSHKGGALQQLGSWSTGSSAEGTEIEVQAGSWTLTLKANSGTNYFSSTKTVTIEPGVTNAVSFVMEYMGKPASLAATGDIIFTNGYATSPSYFADFVATPEAIAVVIGGTVYGISLTASQVSISNINTGIPAGWLVPSLSILQSIYSAKSNINSGLVTVGASINLAYGAYWASDTHPVDGQGYLRINNNNNPQVQVYYTDSNIMCDRMLVKQY